MKTFIGIVKDRFWKVVILVLSGLVLIPSVLQAAGPDNITVVVNKSQVTGGDAGSLGGFTYNSLTHEFWIALFGSGQGIRKYVAGDTYPVLYTSKSDIELFARSTDLLGGEENTDGGGTFIVSGFLLNPQTVTFDGVSWAPGTLIIGNQIGTAVSKGTTTYYDQTKRFFAYDLRKIGTTIPGHLDYDLDGIADWNDVFFPALSQQAINGLAGETLSRTINLGRNFGWSSDGQSIYFVVMSTYATGGVWKYNLPTNTLSRIYFSNGSTTIGTEPGVLNTSVRKFNSNLADNKDQVLFRGSTASGNIGGFDYLVDNGNGTYDVYPLFTAADFAKYFETNGRFNARLQVGGADPGVNPSQSVDVASVAVDAEGNVYFTASGTGAQGIWRYDTEGHLAAIKTRNQHTKFNLENGKDSTGGSSLRLLVRDTVYSNGGGTSFTVPQVLFQSVDLVSIGGVYAFKSGDFNRDNVVNADDFNLFKAALATPIGTFTYLDTSKTYYFEAPTNGDVVSPVQLEIADPNAYVNYLKFDLNGNGLVTEKDIYLLSQFYPALLGDANVDGLIDVGDLGILAANYGGTGKTWKQGDFNNDGVVDVGDLGILAAHYGQGTVSSSTNFDIDYAKAFGIATADETSGDSLADDSALSTCSSLGLPLIVSLLAMGLMLVKLEE